MITCLSITRCLSNSRKDYGHWICDMMRCSERNRWMQTEKTERCSAERQRRHAVRHEERCKRAVWDVINIPTGVKYTSEIVLLSNIEHGKGRNVTATKKIIQQMGYAWCADARGKERIEKRRARGTKTASVSEEMINRNTWHEFATKIKWNSENMSDAEWTVCSDVNAFLPPLGRWEYRIYSFRAERQMRWETTKIWQIWIQHAKTATLSILWVEETRKASSRMNRRKHEKDVCFRIIKWKLSSFVCLLILWEER